MWYDTMSCVFAKTMHAHSVGGQVFLHRSLTRSLACPRPMDVKNSARMWLRVWLWSRSSSAVRLDIANIPRIALVSLWFNKCRANDYSFFFLHSAATQLNFTVCVFVCFFAANDDICRCGLLVCDSFIKCSLFMRMICHNRCSRKRNVQLKSKYYFVQRSI